MNKIIAFAAASVLPLGVMAQSSIDAYNLSQGELRGTARFMSMAGAFTALGGDLSSMGQNPAGIGLYRGNDIGITLDLNILSSKSSNVGAGYSTDNTHFDVNNLGYVGTFNLDGSSALQTFSWGVTYSRINSFERESRGGGLALNSSLSNYIALCTDGISPSAISEGNGVNPYASTDYSWLSILSYNSAVINPVVEYTDNPLSEFDPSAGASLTSTYNGLFQQPAYDANGNMVIAPTTGVANFLSRERGYVDEYLINFGGNVSNVAYFGLGIGIHDVNFEQSAWYEENLNSANVPASSSPYDGITEGNCTYTLSNWKKITGSGANLKLGVILKPINEFRLGVAVHTPTWYSLRTSYGAESNLNVDYTGNNITDDSFSDYTDNAYYDWNLRSPWKVMVGAAGVIGGRAILSVDYEYQTLNKAKSYDAYGDFTSYNDDIHDFFKATNIVRVGAEYRVTPQFSLRAGYSYYDSNINSEVKNNQWEVPTAGCNPAYQFNNSTNYITAGLGYRTSGFYVDMAYVHKQTDSTYHAFTSFIDYDGYWSYGAEAKMTDKSNQLVLTLGYKF